MRKFRQLKKYKQKQQKNPEIKGKQVYIQKLRLILEIHFRKVAQQPKDNLSRRKNQESVVRLEAQLTDHLGTKM